MLKMVAGTAGVGAAAWGAYSAVTGGSVSTQGAKHGGERYTEAQRHSIDRQLVDQKADVGGRSLGKWIALLPTKMGGGVYALDLNTNRVLASVWYWNYGDFNPIAHHLCAFPSADPYRSFEFVNSTQGGKNSLIYGINTKITTPGPGFNNYDLDNLTLTYNVFRGSLNVGSNQYTSYFWQPRKGYQVVDRGLARGSTYTYHVEVHDGRNIRKGASASVKIP